MRLNLRLTARSLLVATGLGVASAAALGLGGGAASAAICSNSPTKTATQAGDWGSTATWGGTAIPVSSDRVCLNTFTITHSAGSDSFISVDGGALSISGGALIPSGTVTLTGLTMTGGQLGSDNGTTPAGAATASGDIDVKNANLGLATINQPSAGGRTLILGSGTSVNTAITSTGSNVVSIPDNTTLYFYDGGGVHSSVTAASVKVGDGVTVNNQVGDGNVDGFIVGSLSKPTGANGSVVGVPVTLGTTGTVSVGAGTLELRGRVTGSSATAATAVTGANLYIDSPFALGGVSGAGQAILDNTGSIASLTTSLVDVASGTTTVTGTYTVGSTSFVGGQLKLPASGATTSALSMTGGTLGSSDSTDPAGALTVNGDITTSNATLGLATLTQPSSAGRTFTLGSGTHVNTALTSTGANVVSIPDNTTLYFYDGAGTIPAKITAASLVVGDNVTVNNQVGAGLTGGGFAVSSLTKPTGANPSSIGVPVDLGASGTSTVTTGTLQLRGGITGTGTSSATALTGATQAFLGGGITLPTITGAGTTTIDNGATNTITTLSPTTLNHASGTTTPTTFTVASTSISGGQLKLPASGATTSALSMTGGTLGSSDSTDPAGALTVNGDITTSNATLGLATLTQPSSAGRTFTLGSGTHVNTALTSTGANVVSIPDNTTLYFYDGAGAIPAKITAASLVVGDNVTVNNQVGAGLTGGGFAVSSLTKPTGANPSSIGVPVDLGASGTSTVTTGTLQLRGGITGTGTSSATALTGATQAFLGGGITLPTITGAGTTTIDNGATNTITTLSPTTLNHASGTTTPTTFTVASTSISGGQLKLPASGATTSALSMTGGTLGSSDSTDPAGALTVNGDITTSNATLGLATLTQPSSAGRTFTLGSGTHVNTALTSTGANVVSIPDNTTLYFYDGAGAIPAKITAASLVVGDNVTVNNQVGAGLTGGGFAVSSLTKPTGANPSSIGVPVDLGASGTSTVTTGTLQLRGGITGTGTSSATALTGATQAFLGGGITLPTITGAGTTTIDNGATNTITTLSPTTLNHASGTTTPTTFTVGSTSLSGGRLVLPSTGATTSSLTTTGGILGSDTNVAPAGALTVNGDISTSNATLGLAALTQPSASGRSLTLGSGTSVNTSITSTGANTITIPSNTTIYFYDGGGVHSSVTAASLIVGSAVTVNNQVGAGNVDGFTVTGSLSKPAGNAGLGVPLTLTSTSTSTLSTGVLSVASLSSAGSLTVGQNAELDTSGTTITAGTTQVDGLVQTINSGSWTITGGTLKGNGTLFAAVTNAGGTVAPGDSPGSLSVNAFTQTSGTLAIEIAGTLPGSYDAIHVSGSTPASIAGTITVTDVGSPAFAPTPGQSFTIVDCGVSTCATDPTLTAMVTDDLPGPVHYGGQVASHSAQLFVAGPPSAPQTVSSSAVTSTSATITWTDPASTNGSAVTSFTVTCSPACGSHTGATSPFALTGLTPGTAYTVSVTATNASGEGPAGTISLTTLAKPGAPTVTGATPGNTKATVTFTAPSSTGGSPVTGYTVTLTPTTGSAVTANEAGPGSYTISGLTNGTTYAVTATATNSVGTGAASQAVNVTPAAIAPSAPTGLTAVADDASATVTFGAPTTTGTDPVMSYVITLTPSGGPAVTTTASAPGSVVVGGLTNGTAYIVTVKALSNAGTGAAATAGPITPLTRPAAVVATGTSPSPSALMISFTPLTADKTITSYTVSCTQVGTATVKTVTGGSSPLTLKGLLNNTDYSCTVHATNAIGNGPEGPAVKGRPGKLPTVKATVKVKGKVVKAVKVGTRLTISGTATVGDKPAAKRTVTLAFTQTGKRTAVSLGKVTTTSKGAFTFTTTFRKAGGFQVRLALGPATAFNKSIVIKRAV